MYRCRFGRRHVSMPCGYDIIMKEWELKDEREWI